MNITFYSFAKKSNSTKQPPANSGTVLSCQLKAETDMLNPTLVINNTPMAWNPIWNYCYIPNFKRYYFINSWTWLNGVWECSCAVDALASWKTDIGGNIEYILRTDSTVVYNEDITDTMYPATTDVETESFLSGTNPFTADLTQGCYIVGIISGSSSQAVGAITYYAMTSAQFGLFKGELFSDDNLITMGLAALDPGTGTLVPTITDMSLELLKTMYNPYQYVASCLWFPFGVSSITNKSFQNTIKLGWWDYPVDGYLLYAQTLDFGESVGFGVHPQAAARGSYLNYAPYTRRELIGRFGSVAIDSIAYDPGDTIDIEYVVDLITGNCRAEIGRMRNQVRTVITYRDFMIGVPIQIAQVGIDYLGTAVSAIHTVSGAISGGVSGFLSGGVSGAVSGAVTSAADGIYNTLNAMMPQVETSGSNGSFLGAGHTTRIVNQYYKIVDEDLTHRGRPVCANMLISSLSGYILCAEGDIDLDCFAQERQMISAFLTGGFFWE